jgi:hypothetical protein
VKKKTPQYHTLVAKDVGASMYNEICSLVQERLRDGENGRQRVYCGTYGNRQGLKTESWGPHSHIIEQ